MQTVIRKSFARVGLVAAVTIPLLGTSYLGYKLVRRIDRILFPKAPF